MKVQKLVVKTAVKTVLILLGIVIAAFAIFNFAFPQHMATAMESLGNYDMAVKYANLRYFYTKDSFDLARCFDDSVLSGNDGSVIYYGEMLMADGNYSKVCSERNELYNGLYSDQFGFSFDYNLRVQSSLSVSYYNEAVAKEGEERSEYIQKAVSFASDANGDNRFPYGNALMTLSVKIINEKDAEAAAVMLAELETVAAEDGKEQNDLNYIKNMLRGVISPSQTSASA